MSKQLLLIPILIGIAFFAGGGILAVKPPQPSLEIAQRETSSSSNDKEKNEDGDGDKGVTAKAIKEPGSHPEDKDERKVGEKNVKKKDLKEPNELGRVYLNEKKVENANLDVEVAGPAKIKATLELYGKITLNEDTVANVSPRYPGVVKAVDKRLGDGSKKVKCWL
jgi:hypothetical protein